MSQTPELIREVAGRAFLFLHLSDIREWPGRLEAPTRHLVAMFIMDATELPTDSLAELAGAALDAGAAYVCAWGPDCERVHDIFDEVIIRREIESGSGDDTIMTTWHSSESLKEATWFFVQAAFPAPAYENDCGSWLAVLVGHEPSAEEVKRVLEEVTRRDER